MNSTIFEEKNDNENHPPNMNSSFSTEESGPSESKKRKLSIGASPSLAAIKLKMLQIENDELKKIVEELENTDLKENNEETLKEQIVLLTSTINDYEEKVKILQDKNQELEESVKEKDVEICTMKTIKSEIKESVEDERNEFQETIKKLNAEINDLKNMNMDLKDMNQNVEKELRDSAIKYENFKEINESRITALEKEILSSNENCQKTIEKAENEKKLFEEMLEKLKVEIKDLKETQKDSEGVIQESKALISKYEKNHENLKKEIAEKDCEIKTSGDLYLADLLFEKNLLKAKFEQERKTQQALINSMKEEKDKITKKFESKRIRKR